ncbi:MAG: hypothetical protein M1368_10460 [Thaumarchaeota archaeon]|nr:hypothetical protein [Nitrososphaerota archaeon]
MGLFFDLSNVAIKQFTAEKKQLLKQFARRRLSVFFFVAALAATIFTISEENDILFHALDDYAIVTLSIVALGIIFAMWKKESLSELKKLNNISVAIAVILLAFVAFAFTQEINDAADFGNDPGQLIFLLLLVINRFT